MEKTYTKNGTKKDIELIKKYLKDYQIPISSPPIDSVFKTKNYRITIYKNDKIMIQGKNYHNILKMIDPIKVKRLFPTNEEPTDNPLLIGSDEVGTGDTFGGIVVAAVYPLGYELLKDMSITDSKVYSNEQIINLFNKIKNHIAYEVYELLPSEYNDLYEVYDNLNIIKTIGHNKSHKGLISKIYNLNKKYSNIIIDEFTPIHKYKWYLKKVGISPIEKEITVEKAESKYLSVALASIVARYYFINQIKSLSEKFNMKIPFGSTTHVIQEALEKAKKIDLRQMCKMHFKSVK